MEPAPHLLDTEEDGVEEEETRPVAMPGSGAPVMVIGVGCYLTLPVLSD